MIDVTDDLTLRSAHEQLGALESREVSARELLELHLDRLEAIGPAINAVVSADPDRARAEAARIDDLRASGGKCPPLAGLPISFKDTHSAAGMRTTFGSPLYADHVADTDDELVRRLRLAGVVPIGKTNVPEFAAGSHTFNSVFGVTRNPYDLTKSAGGSSGGAAAALAAGLQPIADGSDMGGSLRNPASFCNVVGLRPTPGRVPDPSPGPHLPLGVAGPMARTVRDVALMLSVIAGPHPGDPTSIQEPSAGLADVDPMRLRGLRVGWAPTLGGRVTVDAEVAEPLAQAVGVFAELGAIVEEACPDLGGSEEVFRTLRAVEFVDLFGEQLEQHPEAFKPDLAWNIREGRKVSGAETIRALAELTRLQVAAEAFFDHYDVLLAPVSQVAPFPAEWLWPENIADEAQHTYLDWMRASYLFTPLGVPAISVPGGFTAGGLPVGLQIITRARSEARLLAIAAAFEDATGFARRVPQLPEVTR